VTLKTFTAGAGSYRALPRGDHDGMVACGSVQAGVHPSNVEKNRYCNICPLDAHRVVLSGAGSDGHDYINASHVVLSHVRCARRCLRFDWGWSSLFYPEFER
jgi:hypothetical protein